MPALLRHNKLLVLFISLSSMQAQFPEFVMTQHRSETRIEHGKETNQRMFSIVTEQDHLGNRKVTTSTIPTDDRSNATERPVIQFFEACSLEVWRLDPSAKSATSEGKFAAQPLSPIPFPTPSGKEMKLLQNEVCYVLPTRNPKTQEILGQSCRSQRLKMSLERELRIVGKNGVEVVTRETLDSIRPRDSTKGTLQLPADFARVNFSGLSSCSTGN